ncbi:MAG: hypothetical protein JO009_00280, partial [Candidatus Eremiobacteraeota bacterium]|nr:hypothetical protein [Candidatus Eremiobacteraeota bacterium]
MKTTQNTVKTKSAAKTARAPKDGKAVKAKSVKVTKAKATPKRRTSVLARGINRVRTARPIARLARLTDPRAALETLTETKGVVKALEAGTDGKLAGHAAERVSFAKIPTVLDIPDLIELQKDSFNWFITEGLREAFASISPIKDFTGNLVLEFGEHSLGEPKYSVEECRERDMTYCAPLRVRVRLITSESGEIKGIPDQEIFMGDFPLMTDKGTFVI